MREVAAAGGRRERNNVRNLPSVDYLDYPRSAAIIVSANSR